MKIGAFFVLSNASFKHDFRIMANVDWSKYNSSEARELARKHGRAILQKMAENLHQMGLIERGVLLKSLKSTEREKAGLIDRIEFSYEFYGKIWETGASNVFGKGVTLEAKHWRNQAIEELKPALDEEFGEFYAAMIIEEIVLESVKLKF